MPRLLRLLPLVLVLAAAPASAELRGHGGPVRALAVSADGATLASGSFDASAIVWSLGREAAEQVLRFHDSSVNAVALLGGGRLATGGEDGRIAIWEVGQAAPVRVLEGHTAPVVALAVNEAGTELASAAWDETARVWSLADGGARVLEGHKGNVNGVAFLAGGGLATAGYDATLRIWPAAGAPKILTLPSPINTLAALDGGSMVVGSADGVVRRVSSEGEVVAEAKVAETPVIALAAAPRGDRVAAAGLRGAIALLEAGRLGTLRTLVGPGLPVWSLAFAPDGAILYSGGSDRMIRLWDPATGAHIGSALATAPADPLDRFKHDPDARVFRACVACHTLTPDGGNRAGPSLAGIFGRRIASLPGYPFSPALKQLDIVWTPETVAKLFEVGPAAYTPGTKMPEQRLTNPEDRAALVRFLQKATRTE